MILLGIFLYVVIFCFTLLFDITISGGEWHTHSHRQVCVDKNAIFSPDGDGLALLLLTVLKKVASMIYKEKKFV